MAGFGSLNAQMLQSLMAAPNPFDTGVAAYKQGAEIAALERKQQVDQLAELEKHQQFIAEQRLQEAREALRNNPNPQFKDFQNVALMATNKDDVKMALDVWGATDKQTQTNEMKFATQVMAALGSKNPKVGINIMKERLESARNAGDEEEVEDLEEWIQRAEEDPDDAWKTIGLAVSYLPGGDKVIDSVTKLRGESDTDQPETVKLQKFRDAALAKGDTKTANEISAILKKKGYIAPPEERGSDVRERKIQDLMAQGKSREESVNIVDGNIKVEFNPVNGRVVVTNTVTKNVSELPVSGPNSGRVAIDPEDTLMAAAQRGVGTTGPVSLGAEAAGRIGGLVPGMPIPEQVLKDRQQFMTAKSEMIRGLSINAKYPVGEIQRIEKEISIAPNLFDSPSALIERMKSIRSSLEIRIKQADRDANDPSLPEAVRGNRAAEVRALQNFLDVLGDPPQSKSGTTEDDDSLINKYLER